MAKQLRVVVVSGLAFSGKTHLINRLMAEDEFFGFKTIFTDPYRQKVQDVLGRPLLLPEHRFKNEAALLDMKTEVVINGCSIMNEMALKTEKTHYLPFSSMVASAQEYLSEIHQAKLTAGISSEESFVELKIVSLFCDLESTRSRIKRRAEQISTVGNVTQTDMFSLASLRHGGVFEFELPTNFQALFVDTSDESVEGVQRYLADIRRFVFDAESRDDYKERFARARAALADLREAVAKEE